MNYDTENPVPNQNVVIKPPPYSLDSEQAVIGSMAIKPACIDEVIEILTADDFYSPEFKVYFQALVDRHSQNKVIDIIFLMEYIEINLPEVDKSAILKIIEGTPSASNVLWYAKAVKDKSTERNLIRISNEIADMCYSGKESTSDKLDKAESMMSNIRPEVQDGPELMKHAANEVVLHVEKIAESPESFFGLETGFANIDERFLGLRGGDLVIIAARPSMGKTAFLMNIAEYNSVKKKKPSLIFSLEMPKAQLTERVISSVGSVPLQDIKTGEAVKNHHNQEFYNAASDVINSPIFIDDTGALNINALKSRARKIKRKHPDLSFIGVDYLQLVRARADSREREIAEVSGALKELAKELDIPVIALSQLNRSLENRQDKRPRTSDLRESGAIEQDADIIAFLYRHEVYYPETEEDDICQFIVGKFRTGTLGVDYLNCQLHFQRFKQSNYLPSSNMSYTGNQTFGSNKTSIYDNG